MKYQKCYKLFSVIGIGSRRVAINSRHLMTDNVAVINRGVSKEHWIYILCKIYSFIQLVSVWKMYQDILAFMTLRKLILVIIIIITNSFPVLRKQIFSA